MIQVNDIVVLLENEELERQQEYGICGSISARGCPVIVTRAENEGKEIRFEFDGSWNWNKECFRQPKINLDNVEFHKGAFYRSYESCRTKQITDRTKVRFIDEKGIVITLMGDYLYLFKSANGFIYNW